MGIALTREQVLALAPDDASAKAAAGLASDGKWVLLGADADAVWGHCQGSGSKPYQAQVDLAALVSRCSCPSRKFPCKHGLALLLLYAQGNPRFADAPRPAWVEEWLASRRERAERKDKAAETAAARTIADPDTAAAARAKRDSARWARIEAGTADLQRWIADQFRRGLARYGPDQRQDWRSMAARMVDAQAPGLAPRIQDVLHLMDGGAGHYAGVVQRLGLLQLLAEAVANRSRLSASRLWDLRIALGWPPEKEDVAGTCEALTDVWCVIGQSVTERDAKLSERRVWLSGRQSGRLAMLQDFSHGGRAVDQMWRQRACYSATVRYYPGTVPLRALASDVHPVDARAAAPRGTVEDAIDSASMAFARNPWIAQLPLILSDATFRRNGSGWSVQTAPGLLPVDIGDADAWRVMAFTGGHPAGLMGEWDGDRLRILAAWDQDGGHWSAEAGA